MLAVDLGRWTFAVQIIYRAVLSGTLSGDCHCHKRACMEAWRIIVGYQRSSCRDLANRRVAEGTQVGFSMTEDSHPPSNGCGALDVHKYHAAEEQGLEQPISHGQTAEQNLSKRMSRRPGGSGLTLGYENSLKQMPCGGRRVTTGSSASTSETDSPCASVSCICPVAPRRLKQ